ncbi:uncharacterized protein N7484_003018 [Penicillium longicatenatum]|uniref:uncharacterized protein n=1 Tax=Penicillium longicatenatum TaxID=1561947 RepID=UPI0025468FB2|nr:uncharacterized protein N7484_003018 [Penicillium longicatenatum]KAJ5649295.1 hypothetical protein N7484_003018 [Penicillium longicatenatum]
MAAIKPPRKGQPREKDCVHGQARWPAGLLTARARFLNQDRGVMCEVRVRRKLCGLMRFPEKIDWRREV